jgi:hypothetical protein
MTPHPRQVLAELVVRYGSSLSHDPRRCEALLRDMCGDQHKRQIFVLVSAVREQVPSDLISSAATSPIKVQLERLSKRMHDNLGITYDLANWGVESWALALGVLHEPITDLTKRNRQHDVIDAADSSRQSPIEGPKPDPGKRTIKGHGQQATESITLKQGVYVFGLKHSGSGCFIIRPYNRSGKSFSSVICEIGRFNGSTIKAFEQGDYLFDVNADGRWEITIEDATTRPGRSANTGHRVESTQMIAPVDDIDSMSAIADDEIECSDSDENDASNSDDSKNGNNDSDTATDAVPVSDDGATALGCVVIVVIGGLILWGVGKLVMGLLTWFG